eukprot:scaffold9302_cov215-Chaetoceros_neogracile.AAC.1
MPMTTVVVAMTVMHDLQILMEVQYDTQKAIDNTTVVVLGGAGYGAGDRQYSSNKRQLLYLLARERE